MVEEVESGAELQQAEPKRSVLTRGGASGAKDPAHFCPGACPLTGLSWPLGIRDGQVEEIWRAVLAGGVEQSRAAFPKSIVVTWATSDVGPGKVGRSTGRSVGDPQQLSGAGSIGHRSSWCQHTCVVCISAAGLPEIGGEAAGGETQQMQLLCQLSSY